jgi:hypothetical protein
VLKNKKRLAGIALGVIACGAAVITLVTHMVSPSEKDRADMQGIVNPDSPKAGLTAEATPQLSQQTFEPPPSLGTGSYTEPAASKPTSTQNSTKKAAAAR